MLTIEPRVANEDLLEFEWRSLRSIEVDLYQTRNPADVDELSWMKKRANYHVRRLRYCIANNHAGYRRFGEYRAICDECGHVVVWVKDIT